MALCDEKCTFGSHGQRPCLRSVCNSADELLDMDST